MMAIAGQDVSINVPRYQSQTGARKSGWNLPAVNCSSSLAKVRAQEITVLFCYTWICLKGTGLWGFSVSFPPGAPWLHRSRNSSSGSQYSWWARAYSSLWECLVWGLRGVGWGGGRGVSTIQESTPNKGKYERAGFWFPGAAPSGSLGWSDI